MLLHQLKPNHIPLYLQGRGFTANDLPDAHVQNDMSVFKWIVHARDHYTEEDLDVHDVFPIANDDWNQVDAPVDGVIADVTTLQTDVNTLGAAHVGIDADITTLETEMDAAEVRLDALEASSGGTTVTFLTQAVTATVGGNPDPTFRGNYSSQVKRAITLAETNIVVWDPLATGPLAALELPELSAAPNGHTVLVHSMGTSTWVYQHATDTAGPPALQMMWGFAWGPSPSAGTQVRADDSYRILKFIKTPRPPYGATDHFWFLIKIDTLNG